jgi:hypothetical protein
MAPPHHIIATPRWLLSLRYTQITLAIIILGISAYGLYWLELSVCSYPLPALTVRPAKLTRFLTGLGLCTLHGKPFIPTFRPFSNRDGADSRHVEPYDHHHCRLQYHDPSHP